MESQPHLSVVVPLYNEEANVAPLVEAVRDALREYDWELLLVDDGSGDGTVDRSRSMSRRDDRIRLLQLARNYGQTAAMQAGFDHARGQIVVSMDGDLQNDPEDIPRLVSMMKEGGYDLVTGYREHRKDKLLTRKVPSWVANWIIARITGVEIRDNGCSLKAYRKSVLDQVQLYSELHRFIPAVAAGTAGARIAEVPVRHHPRRRGESKYGLSRTWRVLIDLLTVTMIRWFRHRPLALFGWGAVAAGFIGVLFLVATLVAVLYFTPYKAESLVFPGVSAVGFGLAFYLLMLGLIGETALYGNRRAAAAGSASDGEER